MEQYLDSEGDPLSPLILRTRTFMAGLVPAIHAAPTRYAFKSRERDGVDGREEPGHDGGEACEITLTARAS